ncbi:MAG: aminotransferase class V-fold PLP-dependent enzyme [Polyangiaceae bacterium]
MAGSLAGIYLDHNATVPPHREVLDAMAAARGEVWANPASVHRPGQRARAELDRCRAALAEALGAGLSPRDVLLTSGGTEANNLALRSVPGALVVGALEHPSVAAVAAGLEREGRTVVRAEATPGGRVSEEGLAAAIAEATRIAGSVGLISVQAVNHETGVVQPTAALAAQARAAGAHFHVDAVQALGRIPLDCLADADLITVAAHKLGGPKGIGALVTRPRVKLQPILLGGEQERGLRPGTQDPILAVGFRAALARLPCALAAHAALGPLRDELEASLLALGRELGIEAVRNGEPPRAPHVSNTSWPGWRGPELCAALDLEGIYLSAGSACSAGTATPSPVITAMVGAERAASAVRLFARRGPRCRAVTRRRGGLAAGPGARTTLNTRRPSKPLEPSGS